MVTVEQVVKELDQHVNACVLPSWAVTVVCEVPGGAHPSYAWGHYARDNSSYLEWDKISSERNKFKEWMQANVLEASPEDFAFRAGIAGRTK